MGEYVEYGFDQQGWYGMFVACGIWCLADVSSVSPSSDVGLTLETSVKHHIPEATNIPYQPCCKCGSFTLHAWVALSVVSNWRESTFLILGYDEGVRSVLRTNWCIQWHAIHHGNDGKSKLLLLEWEHRSNMGGTNASFQSREEFAIWFILCIPRAF